jgi:hypothetical protein
MKENQAPSGRRRDRRWRPLLSVAAAVMAGALSASVHAAAPAQAVSQTVLHPEWIDGCGGCPGPSIAVAAELDQRAQYEATAALADGLAGMIAAGAERDPAMAERLRGKAIGSFAHVAGIAGSATFSPVGDWDGELCPRPWPWPWPWPPQPDWGDIEWQVADGLNLLGEAALTQDAERAAALRDKAENSLESAAAGLQMYENCA